LNRKIKSFPLVFIFIFALLCPRAPGVFAKSVRFFKSIYFQGKGGKKNLGTFLLGKGKKNLIKPSSLCRLNEHRICITDTINGLVVIIDNQGKIKKKLTRVKGFKIVSPVCAGVDDRGDIYVSDSALEVVFRFDGKYKFKGIFISSASSPKGARITGFVFCRATGVFYCVDTANHRVLCFDREGTLKFSFGNRGAAHGQFNFPTHITADNEFIYVTDALNFRVQVFDHSGTFKRVIGSHGRGGGNFSKPKGIAVDKERRIFAADAMFDNVQIFNFNGQFLYYFGAPGHDDGEFWMPTGIMVDSDDSIWVADTYNSRIQVFKLAEDAP
jgi:DNA-binding beta-propeller fold protein YncE